MHAKCDDAGITVLDFDINIQSKHKKTCLEYEEYNITKRINQNCTLERSYHDYTVESSLTGEDIYEDNPMCIRINNLFDARPMQELTLNYITKGFAKTIIKKAFINSEEALNLDNGYGNYVMTPQEAEDAESRGETTATADYNVKTDTDSLNCSDISEAWVNNIHTKLNAFPKDITSSSFDGSFSNGSVMQLKFLNATDAMDCDSKQSTYGSSGLSADYNSTTNVCKVYYSKATEDSKWKYIAGLSTTNFLSETAITKDECKRYAYVLVVNIMKVTIVEEELQLVLFMQEDMLHQNQNQL
jgi:hypothetical protein